MSTWGADQTDRRMSVASLDPARGKAAGWRPLQHDGGSAFAEHPGSFTGSHQQPPVRSRDAARQQRLRLDSDDVVADPHAMPTAHAGAPATSGRTAGGKGVAPTVPAVFCMGTAVLSVACLGVEIIGWRSSSEALRLERTDALVRCCFAVLVSLITPLVWRRRPEVWAMAASVAFVCNAYPIRHVGAPFEAKLYFFIYVGVLPLGLVALFGAFLSLVVFVAAGGPAPSPRRMSINGAGGNDAETGTRRVLYSINHSPEFGPLFAGATLCLCVAHTAHLIGVSADPAHIWSRADLWWPNWAWTVSIGLQVSSWRPRSRTITAVTLVYY